MFNTLIFYASDIQRLDLTCRGLLLTYSSTRVPRSTFLSLYCVVFVS